MSPQTYTPRPGNTARIVRLARSLAAIVLGLLLISLLAEAIEFALVALLNGEPTTDPAAYIGIRNRPPVLAAKLAYNALAGLAGGYAAAWVARRAGRRHALALALIQATTLLWALFSPLGGSAPRWLWVALILTMTPAIVAGGTLRERGLFARVLMRPARRDAGQ